MTLNFWVSCLTSPLGLQIIDVSHLHLVYTMPGIKPRLYVLDNHSANWATFPAPILYKTFKEYLQIVCEKYIIWTTVF